MHAYIFMFMQIVMQKFIYHDKEGSIATGILPTPYTPFSSLPVGSNDTEISVIVKTLTIKGNQKV